MGLAIRDMPEVIIFAQAFPCNRLLATTALGVGACGRSSNSLSLRDDRRVAERTSLAQVLERYRREVTHTKRGSADERHPFTDTRKAALTRSYLAAYCDEHPPSVSRAAVSREFKSHRHRPPRMGHLSPLQ